MLLLFNSFTFQYERFFPGILFWYTLIYKFFRFRGRFLSFILDICPLINNLICFKSRVFSFVLHICPLIIPIYAEGYIVFVFLFVRSFVRTYVRSFVRSFVRLFVRSFVLPSRSWNYFKVLRSSNSSGVHLTNHPSESIQFWTIGTLEGRLSSHDSSLQGPCPGAGLEVKI